MLGILSRQKKFSDLNDREIIALAISAEEDDARIYASWADRLREDSPATAAAFDDMSQEEDLHRARLIKQFKARFDGPIPLVRREHIAGFYRRNPVWLADAMDLDAIRSEAERMERAAGDFYSEAAKRTGDPDTRRLLGDLAAAERGHEHKAGIFIDSHVTPDADVSERDAAHRRFVLTWVQPGLAGLMDGSVSTLAPIFATAFATQDTWTTFLVGLAASVGAGISMGFTEYASDDGVISGRGSAWKRGVATGVMTTVGGLGHALPYLIPHFWTATIIAMVVVLVELWAIAWIQNRWMQTPWHRAIFQVVLGGALVLGAGILIGAG